MTGVDQTQLEEAEAVKGFLAEYRALVEKYGFAIDGCSCCNNPWVTPVENIRDGQTVQDHIDHLTRD